MVTFCDILHEAKQKNKNKLSRVRSTDWRSALIYWIDINDLNNLTFGQPKSERYSSNRQVE